MVPPKSYRQTAQFGITLIACSFLIANAGSPGLEDPLGPYHLLHSFVPWLLQWGAIALFLGMLTRNSAKVRERLSPKIVLPWCAAGVVWWVAVLSVLWQMSSLEFAVQLVSGHVSETFGGPVSRLDWLLYFRWFVNPYESSVPFSLVGWGGVTAFVHSVSMTAVCCILAYAFRMLEIR